MGISDPTKFPAKWIWLGVSVEDQARADERIPFLLDTPAAVRFISAEPLLGPINLTAIDAERGSYDGPMYVVDALTRRNRDMGRPCPDAPSRLDWVIAGAESGPGARPMDENWVRTLRDQCTAAKVAFFYKQRIDSQGHKVSLPELDGRIHNEFPKP
jgi:protein gp37